MRKPAAIVEAAVDLEKLRAQWDLACGAESRAETSLGEARLKKGRLLVEARKAFPARGPKAKGWGELLAKWGIDDETARRYMKLAGYVEDFPQSEGNHVPTYAEAGIVKPKPAGAIYTEPTTSSARGAAVMSIESDGVEDDANDYVCSSCSETFPLTVWHCPGCAHHWDYGRETCWNCHEYNSDGSRVVIEDNDAVDEEDGGPNADHIRKEDEAIETLFPSARNRIPPIDERAKRAHRIASALTSAKAQLSACFKVDNVHLTDVSTSPAEFEQVKGLIIEMINDLLNELDSAGVLDGTEKRKQLKLLDGGTK